VPEVRVRDRVIEAEASTLARNLALQLDVGAVLIPDARLVRRHIDHHALHLVDESA